MAKKSEQAQEQPKASEGSSGWQLASVEDAQGALIDAVPKLLARNFSDKRALITDLCCVATYGARVAMDSTNSMMKKSAPTPIQTDFDSACNDFLNSAHPVTQHHEPSGALKKGVDISGALGGLDWQTLAKTALTLLLQLMG